MTLGDRDKWKLAFAFYLKKPTQQINIYVRDLLLLLTMFLYLIKVNIL
jgi:hypothetical protein